MKRIIFMATLLAATILTLLLSSCEEEFPVVPVITTPSLSATHQVYGSTSMDTMDYRNFVITISNTGTPTTDRCTIDVQKFLPLGGVHFSEFLSTMEGVSVDNVSWRVTDQATRYRFISEPGYVITANSKIGLTINSYNLFGSFSITSSIKNGTGGGEEPSTDNITVTHFKIE